MEENRARRILFAIVIIFVGNTILGILFFGKGTDALYYVLKRHEIRIENGTEYIGTPRGYTSREISTEYGSQTQYYQSVSYTTEDGTEKTVVSSMTDEDRGDTLPECVIVLDNGERAVIQEDLDAMQHHINVALIAALSHAVLTFGTILVFVIIGKRERRAAQW
ncbi:MAG: hypothetical protein IKX57_05295 [Oscillospiraceae bacterium]|nr:hypothetical protein [Oscillospiraceae bacterium]MBR5723025.1 hypothetical protein [Oscillospiraceae bacterium]